MNNKELRQAIENIVAIPNEFKPTKGELFGKQVAAVDKTAHFIRQNFKVILDQLKKTKPSQLTDSEREGLQALMLKIGEVDRITSLFHKVKEYDELKGLYKKLTEKKTRRLTSSKIEEPWSAEKTPEVESEVKKVKQDTDYELFYLKKEDGSSFFSPNLASNMPLTTNATLDEFTGEDPFLQIKGLLDRRFQMLAEEMIKRLNPLLSTFFQEYKKQEFNLLVPLLSKSIMALMLAANSRNLLKHFPVKSSHHYFKDFDAILRQIFDTLEYKDLKERDLKRRNKFENLILELIQGLGAISFSTPFLSKETENALYRLTAKAKDESDIFSYISEAFNNLKKTFSKFPEGPLFKGFDLLMEKDLPAFDPFLLDNWPHSQFKVDLNHHSCDILYIPSPTTQEVIHRASICEEFKCFLESVDLKKGHHLLINLQDRTAWKEHARIQVLEDLQNEAEYHDVLTVVTLAKDTDFYFQEGEYYNLNHATDFTEQFKEHLISKECGFYFPKKIAEALFNAGFVDNMLHYVHTHFFSRKNVLSRRERLDFIELAYILIVEKLIEITNATSISFTCKDGIDVGSTMAGALFAFNKLKHMSLFTQHDKDALLLMLFAPAFLLRERLVQEERLMRLLGFIKLLDEHREALKEAA